MALETEYTDESAFYPTGADGGYAETEVLAPEPTHSPLPKPEGPTLGGNPFSRRRTNLPDLNIVAADIQQLNLDQVSPEEIAALCAVWLKRREKVDMEGYQPEAGGPRVFGVHAKVAIGVETVVQGVIALRDPDVREAMRVQTMMLDADDPNGGVGNEEDEDELTDA